MTELELRNAPQKVQDYFNELDRRHMERVEISQEGFEPGQTYVNEKVVGQTSFDDCVHIVSS